MGSATHRRRLEDLYVVAEAVSEALADAANQPFWAEKRGGYQLPGKLKRKMRERLLG